MTDLITENARLRAALEAMLHRHILYCGGESMAFAGHTDVALFQEARAALATPASDNRKEVMPDDEAANPADARYATSPGVTAGADYAAGFAEGIRRAAEAVPNGWQGQPHVSGMDYGPTTAAKAKSAILALTTDATPAPDAVQEAARVLLDDEGRALPRLVEIAEAQWDAGSSMFRCIGAALRAIAGGQP